MKARRGFTLIEVAIIIFIVSVLVTVTLVMFQRTQVSARDTERQSDVILLKNAIDNFYTDNGYYPSICPVAGNSCDPSVYLAPVLVPKYIDAIPTPPNSYGVGYYPYVTNAASNSTAYGILVQNEARAHCKTGANLVAGWFSSSPTCAY